jgi:hypothetical protein
VITTSPSASIRVSAPGQGPKLGVLRRRRDREKQ